MVADIFTKPLPPGKFFKFRDYMLNLKNAPGIKVDAAASVLRGKAARLWNKLMAVIEP